MATAEQPAERGRCRAFTSTTESSLSLACVPQRAHKVWHGSEACLDASSHEPEFVYLWIDFINCFYVIQVFFNCTLQRFYN